MTTLATTAPLMTVEDIDVRLKDALAMRRQHPDRALEAVERLNWLLDARQELQRASGEPVVHEVAP